MFVLLLTVFSVGLQPRIAHVPLLVGMPVFEAERRLKVESSTRMTVVNGYYVRNYRSPLYARHVVEIKMLPERSQLWRVAGWTIRDERPNETFIKLGLTGPKLLNELRKGMSYEQVDTILELWGHSFPLLGSEMHT